MLKECAQNAKNRLLQAAIKTFASHSFEGASTRMLAKEAKVNISAIPYYFGSKEGLYEAVIRHIISISRDKIDEKINNISEALNHEDLTHDKAKDLLSDFIVEFSGFLLSEQASPYMAQIMVREQIQPSFAFERFYEDMMKPIHRTITKLIAYMINENEDSIKSVLCTQTIWGQLLAFKTHKQILLRRTGWEKYGAEEFKQIIDIILRNTYAIIDSNRKNDT